LQARFCGDGIVDGSRGEECDQGAGNGQPAAPCDKSCRLIRQP
jgi:hypothetical protein